jgi:shikimate kinase
VIRSDVEHVALVGLSGSGKSTAAPLIASRTGLAVVDLDRVVAEQIGRPIAELFAEPEGEARFRTLETEALLDALAGPPAVIATGGGVVLDAANRSSLRSGAHVVWLRAHPSRLAARLADTTEARPLLDGDVEFALQRLSEERAALYDEVADVVIDVDGVDPLSVAEEIVAGLGTARP